MRKLPIEVYDEFRRLRESGMTYAQISNETGYDRGTIHRCVTKRDVVRVSSWETDSVHERQRFWATAAWR